MGFEPMNPTQFLWDFEVPFEVELMGYTLMLFLYLQEAINTHNEPVTSSYGGIDSGLRYSYSQLGSTSYPSSSFSSQSYGGYGSSNLGGYSAFRL